MLSGTPTGTEVVVMGWVRTFRNNQFIALNDGSTNANIQIVATLGEFDEAILKSNYGSLFKNSGYRSGKFRQGTKRRN